MKTIRILAVLWFAALVAAAAPVYEPFDYPPDTSLLGKTPVEGSTWVPAGPTGDPIMVRFVGDLDGDLDVPDGSLPVGNFVQLEAIVGPGARLSLGDLFTSGSVSFSFLLLLSDVSGLVSNDMPVFIAGLDPAVQPSPSIPQALGARVWVRASGEGYNIGLSKTSPAAQDVVWGSENFDVSDTLFIAGIYTFVGEMAEDDDAQLWILKDTPTPDFFSKSPPATLTSTAGDDLPRISSFTLLQLPPAAAPCVAKVDELRIGTAWAEVAVQGPPRRDFGDAPAPPYPTLLPAGARHRVGPLRLGTQLDAEPDGQPVDNDGADEDLDGVYFPPFLTPGAAQSVAISASGPAGYVDLWIDMDGIPGWGAADHAVVAAAHPGGGATVAYPFTVPAGAPLGPTWARVRLGLNPAGLPPGGWGGLGEVADYQAEINNSADLGVEFGPLPPELDEGELLSLTMIASNIGPSTATSVQLSCILPQWADLESITSSRGSCEVVGSNVMCSVTTLAADESFTVEATVSVDPSFGEQEGEEFFDWDWLLSVGAAESDPDSANNQAHGIVAVKPKLDFGDARSGYPVTRAENGARHRNGSVYHLGALFDRETNGVHSAAADYDDLNGMAPDDEDGVTLPSRFIAGRTETVTVTVPVAGFLDAFFDWNNDGDWVDPTERVTPAAGLAIGPGAVPVAVAVPLGAVNGNPHARFRFSDAGGLASTGFNAVGEVEDYEVQLLPPLIIFGGLEHEALGDAVLVVESNKLHVSQIGSSGADGVLLKLGEAEGWQGVVEAPLDPAFNPEGTRLGWQINGLITDSTNDRVYVGGLEISAGEVYASSDFSAVGATAQVVCAWSNGVMVASNVVPPSGVVYKFVGSAVPRSIIMKCELPIPDDQNPTCSARWPQSCPIVLDLPNGPVVNADEVTVAPLEASAVVESFFDIGVEVSITPDSELIILDPAIKKFGLWHRALGGVQMNAVGTIETEIVSMELSNIGSSGQDGIETMAAPEEDGFVDDPLWPIGYFGPDKSLRLEPVGLVDGSEAVLGSLVCSNVTLNADFTPMGADNLLLEVWDNDQLIGSQTVSSGTLGTLTAQGGDPVPLPNYGCFREEPGAVVVGYEFDEAVIFTPASGPALTGNTLRCIATGTDPVDQLISLRQYWAGLPDVALVIPIRDHGDAPIPYPVTKAENGASHRYGINWRLGTQWDREFKVHHSGAADYDDTHGAASDDEDGVAFVSTLGTITVEVEAGRDGNLDAWMDFNRDGDWDDADEQIFNTEPLSAGPNTRYIMVPSYAAAGTFVSRWRFSETGGLSYKNYGGKGEVEDHVGSAWAPEAGGGVTDDFGDAPDDDTYHYPTLLAHGGAQHTIVPGWQLGTFVDAESDGQPSLDALLDDDTDIPDDEDGVTFLTALARGGTASVQVNPSTSGHLDAWIDFNRDGYWGTGLPEQIFSGEPVWPGMGALTFAVPSSSSLGGTYARFRFSEAGGLSPGGPAAQGEVEDYGPEHGVVITGDGGDNPNLKAEIQPDVPEAEEGVAFNLTVTVSNIGNGTATEVLLEGLLTLAPEGSVTVVPNTPSQGSCQTSNDTVTWNVGTLPPQAVSTLVLSVVAAPEFTGEEQGELEFPVEGSSAEPDEDPQDNQATIQVPVWTMRDWGDALDPTYPTTFSINGARHRIIPGFYLGSNVDSEPGGLPTPTASGDDTTGVDDEDGVTFDGPLYAGRVARVHVTASESGCLDAWVDFDRDGVWQRYEQVIASSVIPAGDSTLSFPVPRRATEGPTFARFRLSRDGGLTPTGFAPDGEVEDHPTAIALPPPPQLSLQLAFESGAVQDAGGRRVLRWDEPDAVLQKADNLQGPWSLLPSADTGYGVSAEDSARFYRLVHSENWNRRTFGFGRWAALLKNAELIFEGIVTSVEYCNSTAPTEDEADLPHTFVTFQVRQIFKGRIAGDTICLRFLGGEDPDKDVLVVSDIPLFDVGERSILFVGQNGRRACPLVQGRAGRYRIIDDMVYTDGGREALLLPNESVAPGQRHDLPEVLVNRIGNQEFEQAHGPNNDDDPGPPLPVGTHFQAQQFRDYLAEQVQAHNPPEELQHPVFTRSARVDRPFYIRSPRPVAESSTPQP